MSGLERVAELAHTAWQIELVESGRELHGPCPFCPGGKDRFIVWAEGNYWCRVCESSGRVPGTGDGPLTRDTVTALKAEKRGKQLARLSEWQKGFAEGTLDGYHRAMRDNALRAYWSREGITDESVERYQLGYVPARTFEGEAGATFTAPAYTLPHVDPVSLALVNCQYRIMDVPPGGGGKYRQEPGLPPASFFTLPKVLAGAGIVCEGGKKAIVLSQLLGRRVQTVGWPGAMPSEELYSQLDGFSDLWLCLDPGPGRVKAEERAKAHLGDRVRVVRMAVKPDDAVVKYGMTRDLFRDFLSQAR